MMDGLMDKLRDGAAKLATVDKIRDALYNTLTTEQQIEVSRKVNADKDAMANWIRTDAGRDAVRALVDKFAPPTGQ